MKSVGRHGRRPLTPFRYRVPPSRGRSVVVATNKMMYPGDLVLVKLSDYSWPAIITHIKDSTVHVKLLVLLTSETFHMDKVVLFEGLAQLEQLLSALTPAEKEDFEETKVCLLNLNLKSRQERLSFISSLGDGSPINTGIEIDEIKENRYLLPTQSPVKPMLVVSPTKHSRIDSVGGQVGDVKKLPCDVQDISLDPIKERVDRMINDVSRDDTRLAMSIEPSYPGSLVNGHAAVPSVPSVSITSPKFSIVTDVSTNSRKRKRSVSYPQTEIVRIDSELQKVIKNHINDGVGSVQILSNPPTSSDRLRSRPSSRISLSPKTEEETEKIVEDLQMMELISFLAPYYINILSSSFKDKIESEIRQNIKNLTMEEKELISKMLVKKVPGRTRKEAQNIISRLLKSSPCKKSTNVVPNPLDIGQQTSLNAPRISLQNQLVMEPTFRKTVSKKKPRTLPAEFIKVKPPQPKEKTPPKPVKKETVAPKIKAPKEKVIARIIESKSLPKKSISSKEAPVASVKRSAMLLYIKDLQQKMKNPLDLKANCIKFDSIEMERKNQYYNLAEHLESLPVNERTNEYKGIDIFAGLQNKARYQWLDNSRYLKKKYITEALKASKHSKNNAKLQKHIDSLLKELLNKNDSRKRKRSTPALTPDSDSEPNAKKEKSDSGTIVDLFCFNCFEIEYSAKLFVSCSNCHGLYHKTCIEQVSTNNAKPKYICGECKQGEVCRLCLKTGNLSTCSKCPHQYHDACVLPHMSTQVTSDTSYICPYHVCGSCDLPPEGSIKSFVRCVRCPQSFHENHIPAGCMRLSKNHILCYRHHKGLKNTPVKQPVKKKGKRSKALVHCNVTFCFQCVYGGNLVCCEECPASFHNECVPEENRLVEGDKKWLCPDCIVGKKPFIGDVIWVKFGSYRWWPCQILDEIEVPDNIFAKVHKPCQFPVVFLGTSDYAWIDAARIYSYEDGDNAETKSFKNSASITNSFKRALKEARELHVEVKMKKDILLKERKSTDTSNDKKPAPFKFIKMNHAYSTAMKEFEKQLKQDRMPFPCDCTNADKCSTESSCINRVLLTECPPSCKWGDKCENMRFQRRQYPKSQLIKTVGRGWGLIAKQDIEPGTLVHEYVGEVIDEAEVERRLQMYQNTGVTDYYMLTVENSRIIDAKPKANNARFMNHSCDPNCETQKWNVCGLTCIGLFAKRRIANGEELTFDYQFDTRGQEKKKCLCGADNCSGFLGEPVKKIEPKESKEKSKKPTKKGTNKKSKSKKKSTKKGTTKNKGCPVKSAGSSTPSESSESSSSKSSKKTPAASQSSTASNASRTNSKESDIYEDVLAIESILKQTKE